MEGKLTCPHPWQGKRAAFIGDSITEGVGSERNYTEYLADMLGLRAFNYGVNGAQTNLMVSLAQRVIREHGGELDAVFVFGGTNDFNSGLRLGDFFAYSEEIVNHNGIETPRRRRLPVFDENTFCGRLNLLLSTLKHGLPMAQTVLLTPIHRGFARFGPANVQPDESYANARGLFLEDYVNAERRAADLWSVPVIDLYRVSGLMPQLAEYGPYFHDAQTDRLHPNALGHLRMAHAVAAALRAVSPTGNAWKNMEREEENRG